MGGDGRGGALELDIVVAGDDIVLVCVCFVVWRELGGGGEW